MRETTQGHRNGHFVCLFCFVATPIRSNLKRDCLYVLDMATGWVLHILAALLFISVGITIQDENVKDLEIDKSVKEQLLNDEMLYQRQKEQEVDEAVQVLLGA